ncbi:hypothetical protein RB597_003999 [Gaeumannomyces tritici]
MALPLLPRPLLRYICSIVLFVACANALKFELQAQSGHGYYDKQQRCIRNFVAKDTLVVVTAIVNGHKGDGMIVNMNASAPPLCVLSCHNNSRLCAGLVVACLASHHHPHANPLTLLFLPHLQIKDAVGNEYGRAKDIVGEQRTVFTSHADAAFDICFENVLEGRTSSSWFQGIGLRAAEVRAERRSEDSSDDAHARTDKYVENPVRSVELDVDIGADAKDWSSIQATEKLKPVETELRRIEEMVSEIVNEMDYLRIREQKLRDTNESTNTRVKWFGMLTTFLLIGLWGWQIMYLRAYFRSKHLI